MKENFWKIGFLGLLLILVGIGAYFFGREGLPQPTVVPTAKPVDETQSIISAVYKKFNSDKEKLDVSVNKIMGDYATGNVKEKTSEVGGGYFLAAKVGGKWLVVYDGQSTPICQQLSSYNFPSTMVPECLGESGKLIKR